MKKRCFLFGILFPLVMPAGAIAEGVEPELSFPDVTAVVSGGTVTAGSDSVEFSGIIDRSGKTGTLVPELPDITPGVELPAPELADRESAKNIFAEGCAGGGFPGLFTGDFSVYRLYGGDPFRLGFSHTSMDGYWNRPLHSGFFDSSTLVELSKTFSAGPMEWNIGGTYASSGDGLQGKSEFISALRKSTAEGDISWKWTLPHGFALGASAEAGLYTRFSDMTAGGQNFSGPEWIKGISVFSFSPELRAEWSGNGFLAEFSADYVLDCDTDGALSDSSGRTASRAEFLGKIGWSGSQVSVSAHASAVVGNHIGGDTVIVPFGLDLKWVFPVYFSDRKVSLFLSGGLDSFRTQISSAEEKFKFSGFSFIPKETSDWFGRADIVVPLKTSFTGSAGVEFRTTALGNGIWEPDYGTDGLVNGVAGYTERSRSLLSTEFKVAYHYKIFSLAGSWKSNWLYLPVLEDRQMLSLQISFQDENSRWGVKTALGFSMDSDDHVPDLGIECFVRLTDAVRLVLSADDVLKLVGGGTRSYSGGYLAGTGKAEILLKFFF